ncbi:MAG: PilZ domain-containing protein, partial [Spirochaetes bacterium]|nr:PilZ domain-containing protein [Spirochaetota bacterium]
MGLILSNKGGVFVQGEISGVRESTRGELSTAVSSSPKIKKNAIINLINHTHFIHGYIHAHIRNTITGDELIVMVYPEPCIKEIVIGRWMRNESFNPADHVLLNLIINSGKALALVPAETISITEEIFIAALPERGYLWNRRQSRRYPCETNSIEVEIIQDYNRIEGTLKDFSAVGFGIRLDTDSFLNLNILDIGKKFFVQLFKEEIIFSGFCNYVKEDTINNEKLVILSPEGHREIRKKRETRSLRLNLLPSPKVEFYHPIMNKKLIYEITDISTSGFSISVEGDESMLIPGMIIKELTILIAGYYQLKGSACIVYNLDKGGKEVRHGFSIIDMDMRTYNQLFNIIANAHDPHVNLSNNTDLESLWEFFFQSKFIYPQKYEMIGEISSKIKDTYDKLYHRGDEVFSNITYQKNGRIYGHISLIRAYERTWLIQHLAAVSKGIGRTGLSVLKYLIEYVDGHFRLPSSNMDYLLFCYRPDNKVPSYLFGGMSRDVANLKIISVDLFAYMMYQCSSRNILTEDSKLDKFSSEDLESLTEFYEKAAGGILLEAIGVKSYLSGDISISGVYREIGLQ